MKHSVFRTVIAIFLVGIIFSLNFIKGQDTDPARSTRNIRVRKLAQNWKEQEVTLISFDGEEVTGILVDATLQRFTLRRKDGQVNVNIARVKAVKLTPGAMELTLAGISGLMSGGLGTGIVSLTSPDAKTDVLLLAGLVGFSAGTWWGYKTFYQEEIIELD